MKLWRPDGSVTAQGVVHLLPGSLSYTTVAPGGEVVSLNVPSEGTRMSTGTVPLLFGGGGSKTSGAGGGAAFSGGGAGTGSGGGGVGTGAGGVGVGEAAAG